MAFTGLSLSAQVMYKPSAHEISTLPAWAQEMYSENPNVFKVDARSESVV